MRWASLLYTLVKLNVNGYIVKVKYVEKLFQKEVASTSLQLFTKKLFGHFYDPKFV